MPELIPEIKLNLKKIRSILKSPEKSAEAVNLIYVKDAEEGIKRIKKGKGFSYLVKNEKLKSKQVLERIKKLVIPPAWKNVWICMLDNGHLQATGLDIKERKQYRYHPLWNVLRNQTKFYRLYAFGEVLPKIRLQLERDLSLPGLPREKVLALVVSLMERTNIRVGNDLYEKLYGSYGLTTLKDKHVKFSGNRIQFTFKGKKGIQHSISVTNKRFAALVKKCRDIPGKELFQYMNGDKEYKSIDSGMVNEYIRMISGADFSAKDFRTWAGTVHALLAFKSLGIADTQSEIKKKIVEALDMVAEQLGNSRTVCKKYYVHPVVIALFEDKKLENYLAELDTIEVNDNKSDLTSEEKLLMKILTKESQKI
ncbi:MAG TPA: DNA topoisomerase IB [Bacteroidia bacterium]